MVREIRLYIEGGGDGSATRGLLRKGFHHFFRDIVDAAQARRVGWNIIVCGGREQTYDAFCSANRTTSDHFNVLLVDSEDPLHGNEWDHLRRRDGWAKPEGISDDQCYLMVQSMETWFIADIDALRSYYGQGFNPNPLPRRQNLEEADRHEIERALKEATKNAKKGKYHKIQHGSALLERINSARVRAALSHCDRIFTTLIQKIQE